nr:hypothetical protein [Tanacetum cinerariifolium]
PGFNCLNFQDSLEELNAIPSKEDLDNLFGSFEVNALQIDLINGLLSKGIHEHKSHEKLKTVIHTSANDQIDSDVIFDDPYVEDNGGQDEHDSNAHDRPYADIEFMINNVQIEAENPRKMNIEMLKQKSVATTGT